MHQKNNKKPDRLCMKFSSNPNASVQRCLNPLFQRTLFRCPSFPRLSQPKFRINKIVHSVDSHPRPLRLVSRTHSFIFHFSIPSLGVYLSPWYLLIFFFKLVYSTMCEKSWNLLKLNWSWNKQANCNKLSPLPTKKHGIY